MMSRSNTNTGHFHTFSALPPGVGARVSSQSSHQKKPPRRRRDTGHDPKEFYKCDFSNCGLTFVRKDLRDRHRRRHRADTSINDDSKVINLLRPQTASSSTTSEADSDDGLQAERSFGNDVQPILPDSDSSTISVTFTGHTVTTLRPRDVFTTGAAAPAATLWQSGHASGPPMYQNHPMGALHRVGSLTSPPPSTTALPRGQMLHSDDYNQCPAQRWTETDRHSVSDVISQSFPPVKRYSQDLTGNNVSHSSSNTAAPVGKAFTTPNINMTYDASMIDDTPYGISPSGHTDDFTAWLFDQNGFGYSGPGAYQPNVFGQLYYQEFPMPIFDQYAGLDDFVDHTSVSLPAPPIAEAETILSDWKRKELHAMIQERFSAGGPSSMAKKQQLFDGMVDCPSHVMSLNSFRTYIKSYFGKFHDQLPLLHEATFVPDQVHDCLLLAVLVIGASMLDDSSYGTPYCDAAAQFGNFVAWSLRWQILMDADSGPPAKLWVLQALAILECHEKMNATRALHERAHVHFAATLTLMRRGSALIGDQSMPPSRDEVPMAANADDRWWSHWIAQEATRRSAFGAFFLDALHATMFGHAAIMAIHEIQLPLPCDDTLWSASTASEVARIEFSLHTNGIKPTMFIVGIKRTLTSQTVRTNPFGRLILMTGLMSIAYHMRQKDLYRGTLEERKSALPEGWKGQLIKAFDFWKQDFDDSFEHMRKSGIAGGKTGFNQERSIVSQHLATALYHLAHIGLQVDMPDLCILAGAKVLLGRVISKTDHARVRAKMDHWAETRDAQCAVFYSIRYLKLTLSLTSTNGEGSATAWSECRWSSHLHSSPDTVLICPWVMYFSALVIWAYGYLLDGPLRPFPEHLYSPQTDNLDLTQPDDTLLTEMQHDAKIYINSLGNFSHPKGIQGVTSGRNKVVGLLGMVMAALESSRWELLQEARSRLSNCLDQLR